MEGRHDALEAFREVAEHILARAAAAAGAKVPGNNPNSILGSIPEEATKKAGPVSTLAGAYAAVVGAVAGGDGHGEGAAAGKGEGAEGAGGVEPEGKSLAILARLDPPGKRGLPDKPGAVRWRFNPSLAPYSQNTLETFNALAAGQPIKTGGVMARLGRFLGGLTAWRGLGGGGANADSPRRRSTELRGYATRKSQELTADSGGGNEERTTAHGGFIAGLMRTITMRNRVDVVASPAPQGEEAQASPRNGGAASKELSRRRSLGDWVHKGSSVSKEASLRQLGPQASEAKRRASLQVESSASSRDVAKEASEALFRATSRTQSRAARFQAPAE